MGCPCDQPSVQVALDDIDLSDQRFRVRRGRGALPQREEEAGKAFPTLLWVRRQPFIVLRGFRHLERIAAESGAGARTVSVLFLEDLQADVSFPAAMRAACIAMGGCCDLSTLECARAIRALDSEGCPDIQVRGVLQELRISPRSMTRALALARSNKALWKAVDEKEITVAAAEVILRITKERNRQAGARPENREDSFDRFIRSVVEEASSLQVDMKMLALHLSQYLGHPPRAGSTCRRPGIDEPKSPREPRAWTLNRKKRLIVYHNNIGLRDHPERLRALSAAYAEVSVILGRWAETSTDGNKNDHPDPDLQ